LSRPELGSIDSRIVKDPGRPTTVKTRYLAGSHHQLLRVDREDTSPLSHEIEKTLLGQLKDDLAATKILLLQDYAKGFFSREFLAQIKDRAKSARVPVILDPNRNTAPEAYAGVTLITPNVAEAERLLEGRISLAKGADTAQVEIACRELKKRLDLEMCLITRSAHGMTLLDKDDRIFHFPSVARSVFDVTGAGDTVIATLAAALAHDYSAEEACWMATAAASVVVAKVGTATASVAEIIPELQRTAQMRSL
jgi:rfaE bifunctional protein kinase chain/domain